MIALLVSLLCLLLLLSFLREKLNLLVVLLDLELLDGRDLAFGVQTALVEILALGRLRRLVVELKLHAMAYSHLVLLLVGHSQDLF